MILETGKSFNDKEHILYVNGAYNGDDFIGQLIHDFRERDPGKMYFGVLSDRAHYLKENEREVKEMCDSVELLVNEGKTEERLNAIRRMLTKLSAEDILDLGYTEEEISQAQALS